jgi:tetratricopeptide (TPR) repeat protein
MFFPGEGRFENYFSVKAVGVMMLVSVFSFTGCAQQQSDSKHIVDGQIAPLLDGMGNHHFEISTDDTLAQDFFNQGLALSYGFNHREANRTFRQVAKLDPENPMAWWGAALVLGPNINAAMPEDNIPRAWEALQKAQELKANGTQKEQDYIEALSHRYAENPPEDRTLLDEAYAKAMSKLAEKYPDDLDAQTLYAEALMDLHPWNYWKQNGEPQPWMPEILSVLESVIERNPNHPGANHLYIHAVEAEQPSKALPSANRLRDLVPGAGHLVHMPAHIYIRTGDYHQGTLANERAVKADNEYVTQCRQQGIYPLAYVPHNYHFLWATATMEGRAERSIQAAQNTSDLIDTETMRQPGMGTLQHYWVIPLYDHVRFARWNQILDYPEPSKDLIYPRGVWHYARGMAYIGKGDPDHAVSELDKLKNIAADDTLQEVTIWDINTTRELMQIAGRVLEGELEAQKGNFDRSIDLLYEAVSMEDQLNYNEPPDWFFPVRHNLGSILLKADRPGEAEKVYRKDLAKFPNNGWSLYGLWESLKAQGKKSEAIEIKKRFEEAWKYADVELNNSRKL